MNWLFLIPLTVGLVTGYVFRNFDEDIAYLTGVISIVSLIFSLVLAPWELQLLILMIIVVNTGKFWFKPNDSTERIADSRDLNLAIPNPEAEKDEDHNLSKYRGAVYEHKTTPIEVTEVEVTVKYRGTPTTIHNYLSKKKKDSDVQLKYRGIPIHSESSEDS